MEENEHPRGPEAPVQPDQEQQPPVESGPLEEGQQGKGYGQDEGERETSLDE